MKKKVKRWIPIAVMEVGVILTAFGFKFCAPKVSPVGAKLILLGWITVGFGFFLHAEIVGSQK